MAQKTKLIEKKPTFAHLIRDYQEIPHFFYFLRNESPYFGILNNIRAEFQAGNCANGNRR